MLNDHMANTLLTRSYFLVLAEKVWIIILTTCLEYYDFLHNFIFVKPIFFTYIAQSILLFVQILVVFLFELNTDGFEGVKVCYSGLEHIIEGCSKF